MIEFEASTHEALALEIVNRLDMLDEEIEHLLRLAPWMGDYTRPKLCGLFSGLPDVDLLALAGNALGKDHQHLAEALAEGLEQIAEARELAAQVGDSAAFAHVAALWKRT